MVTCLQRDLSTVLQVEEDSSPLESRNNDPVLTVLTATLLLSDDQLRLFDKIVPNYAYHQ